MTSSAYSRSQTAKITHQGLIHSLRNYWLLIKDLQTGLLLVTAAAGYFSGCCLNLEAGSLGALLGSLFLAVSGSTVLNMAIDRDIDACMTRTCQRPLPAGLIASWKAWLLGALLTAGGMIWAISLGWLYAGVVAAGVVLDVLVYTVWLKRRTPFSILFGGISGGMPILAGRVLATGKIDPIGLLLAFAILLWIPTHIMTFNIKYQKDYAAAGIPTFPSTYGVPTTRVLIALSTLLTVAALLLAGFWLQISLPVLITLAGLGILMMLLVAASIIIRTRMLNFVLYKGASIFMLLSMILLILGGI